MSTLRVTTTSTTTSESRIVDFPGMQAVIGEDGAVWVGDAAALKADRKGKPSDWEAWFAPGTVEYTRLVD